MWLSPELCDRQMEVFVNLFEISRDEVAHFNILQVAPSEFDRIQIGGITGQKLQVDPLSRKTGDILIHGGTSVNRRPVPDDQPALRVVHQVRQIGNGMQAIQRFLPCQGVEPPFHRNSAHYRQMVSCLPLVQHRRRSTRGVRFGNRRQQVKARFIDKNKCSTLAPCTSQQFRPDFHLPAFDFRFIAMQCPRDRNLRCPFQLFQYPGDVPRMVRHPEFLLEYRGHPLAVPIFGPEAYGFRGSATESRESNASRRPSVWKGAPEPRMCKQGRKAPSPGSTHPTVHRPNRHAQSLCNRPSSPSVLHQIPSTKSAPFPPVVWLRFLPGHDRIIAIVL